MMADLRAVSLVGKMAPLKWRDSLRVEMMVMLRLMVIHLAEMKERKKVGYSERLI